VCALLRTAFTSEGGARIPVALLLAAGFVVGATFGLAKVVRDGSLTCNVGYELAPLGMLAIAVAVLPVGALRVRLEQRWGFRRWNGRSALAVAAVFVAFWGATHGLLHGRDLHPADPSWSGALRWTYLLFFVWVGVAGAILGPNVKGTVDLAVVPERRSAMLALSAAALPSRAANAGRDSDSSVSVVSCRSMCSVNSTSGPRPYVISALHSCAGLSAMNDRFGSTASRFQRRITA